MMMMMIRHKNLHPCQRTTTHKLFQVLALVGLCLLLFVLTHQHGAHCIIRDEFSESKSFTTTGQPNLKNIKATVYLQESQSRTKCEFRFSTIDCEDVRAKLIDQQQQELQKKEPQQPRQDYIELQLLNGECFKKQDGYWTYTFCVGGEFTQSHGSSEVYILGKYASTAKDTQYYEQGTVCVTNQKGQQQEEKKRRISVKYMCGKSGNIISIAEPEMCVYHAVVTHPALCGDQSAFDTHSGSGRDLTSQVAQSPLDYWMLSLEKTSSGSYICSLRSVMRDIKQKMSTCFSEFSLKTTTVPVQDQETDDDDQEVPHKVSSVLARQEKRKLLPRSQMSKIPGGVKNNPNKFVGFLEYAHIKSEPKKLA